MKILVVVDMQNDFVTGALGSAEAVKILPRLAEKANSFSGPVIYTADTHNENYLETQEGRLLPVKHCIKGTKGHAICPEFNTKGRKIFEKPSFGSKELMYYLADIKDPVDEIIFTGVCTDICVISNAIMAKAFLPEVKITVDASLCAGVTPEAHKNALFAMRQCQISVENE